jgi:acetyl esterase
MIDALIVGEENRLDPQARAFLDRLAAAKRPPLSTLEPAQARLANARLAEMCAGPAVSMARVEDRAIPGPRGSIDVRIYTPHAVVADAAAPVLVYFHGGGFVIGDIAMADGTARMLADEAACIVVSVAYRLAPEFPYPAPREDAFAATAWVAANATSFGGDGRRVAVGGDSAGATLAAIVALVARDRGGPALAFQLLVYMGSDRDLARPSMTAFGADYLLTLDTIRWFQRHHYDGPATHDPYLAPLEAEDLRGLPPAVAITAGFDPLRDGGERYAERLAGSGVPTRLVRYAGAIHGFFLFPAVFDDARDAIARSARALRTAFSRIADPAEVGSHFAE